jgi:hypothetical protein
VAVMINQLVKIAGFVFAANERIHGLEGVALILDIDLKLLEQPSVEDEKCQFYSRLPTVTECESSELHDVLACVFLPARSTALHPHFEQTFTGCFDVASTKRQTKSARTGIA